MALNLEKLVFEVDTTQLEDAAKKIDALGTSLTKINKPAEKAAIASEKLAKAQADTATANAKAEIASAKAAVATQKLNKAQEVGVEATKRSLSIQERQATILEFMNQGYTKGQSSVLAYAKAAGEATDEIAKILDMQRKIAGGDPFDKSLSGIKSLKNELEVLTQVEKLYAQGADLTTKQVRNLSLDRERLVQRMRQEGATIAQIQAALKNLNAEYIALATGVNKIAGAEAAMIKSRREAAAATKYLADADARLAAALDETNKSLDKGATDALVKYEKALKTSGMSADEAAAKLAVAKKQFEGIADKKQADRLQYLARAISVQMGDVGISLASGMNPLLVMIQQGDQIRGAIQQAGASGKELEKAMGNAATQIATSFAQTGKAIGGFFVSAIKSAGDAILGLPLALGRSGLAAMGLAAETNAVAFERLKLAAISFGKAGIVAIIAGLATLGKMMYDALQVQRELSVSLATSGSSMRMNRAEAIEYAQSLSKSGKAAVEYTDVILAMAKAGFKAGDNFKLIADSAIEMQKYAGKPIADTVKAFEDLADKPVEGIAKLAKESRNVTAESIRLVNELTRQGKMTEAVAVATKEMARVNADATKQIAADAGYLERIWMDVIENIAKGWKRVQGLVLGWGTEEPLQAQLSAKQKELAGFKEGDNRPLVNSQKKRIQDEITGLQEQIRLQNRIKTIKAENDSRAQGEVEWQKLINANVTDEVKVRKELERIKEVGLKAGKNAFEIQKLQNDYLSKQPKGPAITVAASKDISIIQKDYAEQLKLAEGFAKDERAILKARFDAGLIDRAEYTAKDVALLQQSEQKQLDVIKQKSAEYATAYAEQAQLLSKAYSNAKDKDNREKLLNDIINLGKEAKEFFANIEDKKGALASAFNARELQVLFGYEKAIRDNNEAYKTLSETQAAYVENRKIESDLQDRLLGATGAEAVAIKAAAEEQKRWTVEIGKFNKVRDDALAEYQKLLSDPASQGTEALRLAATRYIAAMQNADKVIADSKLAVQNTTTDAVVAYYKAEFERINTVITDAIVTALFEGGKAGSKKIRDLITAELKKPITIVVRALLDASIGGLVQKLTGGSGGSTLGNLASLYNTGSAAFTIGSQYAAGTMSAANAAGTLFANATGTGIEGLLATNGAYGTAAGTSSFATSAAAAGPYVLAAVAALNALGVFKSTKTVGGGLTGTLGAGNVESYNLTRTSGTLFNGPSYNIAGQQKTQESVALESAFMALRDSTTKMAEDLGLSTEKIKSFTMAVGDVKVHPDIDKLGLVLDGLSNEDKVKKIEELLNKSSNAMAEIVLGAGATAEQLVQIYNGVMGERYGLETQLLELQGNTAELRNRERAQLHESNRALYDQIKALEDLKNTTVEVEEGMIEVAEGVKIAVQDISSTMKGLLRERSELTIELMRLQGDTELANKAVRDLATEGFSGAEIAAYDYNRSLEAQIKYFNDAAQVAQKLAEHTKEKNSLEIDLLRVQGKTREADLAAYALATQGMSQAEIAAYKYNRALESQIQSYVDANAAADAYAQIVQGLAKEQTSLEIQLLQVQGRTTEANAALRALAIEGMQATEIAAYDYNRALEAQIQSYVDAAELAKKLAEYTKERKSLEVELLRAQGKTQEAEAAAYALATEGMSALERAAYDYNQALRDQIQSYSDIKTATDKAFESLKASIESTISELEKSFTATDVALSNVEKAISAERDLAQVRLDSALKQEEAIKAVFDVLKSSISDIRGGTLGTSGASRDLITNAIKTGKLPDAGALSDAISNVRQSIEGAAYVSKTDQRRASLLLANELESLQKIAEPQLSSAEQAVVLAQDSVAMLDSQLKLAQDQVSILRGIDTGILSVSAAVNNLQSAILTEANSRREIENLNTVMQQSTDQYNSMRDVNSIVVPILSAVLGFKNAADTESVNVFNPSSTTLPSASLNTVSTYSSAQGSTMVESVTSGSGSVSELQALRQEIALMRSETATTAINTGKTARILDRATQENGAILVVSAV